MYSQVHHAAVDGQAAVALANVLFDLGPEPRVDRDCAVHGAARLSRSAWSEMLRGAPDREVAQVAGWCELPATLGTVAAHRPGADSA